MSSRSHPVDLHLADRDWYRDELYIDWRAASADADTAYAAWTLWPTPDRYAAYVAATDRADAAADHLAAAHEPARRGDRVAARRWLFART